MGPAGIAMGAASAVGSYMKSRSQKKQAKRAQKAMERQRSETLGLAGPENYGKNFQSALKMYQDAYMPHLRSIGEALALGEQAGNQGAMTYAGRHGGNFAPGLMMALQGAQHSSRMGDYATAQREAAQAEFEGAQNTARGLTSGQVGASLGAPYSYVPSGPHFGEAFGGAVQSGLAAGTGIGSMMGYGRGGLSSWFRRPQSSPNYAYVGTPSPSEMRPYEGTDLQWGFNPSR